MEKKYFVMWVEDGRHHDEIWGCTPIIKFFVTHEDATKLHAELMDNLDQEFELIDNSDGEIEPKYLSEPVIGQII